MLLTVKLDDFGQISHINHISASIMEKPLPVHPVHGVKIAANYKRRVTQHRSALPPPLLPLSKVLTTAALCRSSIAAAERVKKPVHGVKRNLDFKGSGDPHTSRLHGGMSKRNKQEVGHSSSACDVSVSDITKVEASKPPRLEPCAFFVGIAGDWGTLGLFNSLKIC